MGTRAIVGADQEVGSEGIERAVTIIPPASTGGVDRRRFLQWGLAVAAGTVIAPSAGCSVDGARTPESTGVKSEALVGPTDGPIYRKWIKLGGEAAIGVATSDLTTTPNGLGSYQTFAGGVIVYSADWGAMLLSTALFNAWLSLNGATTSDGQNLLTYVGFPREDFIPSPGLDTGHFERGMIVISGGVPSVVYGYIYEHYFLATPPLGLPTGAQASAPGGGVSQTFQGGDIYWRQDTGASVVRGAIRARWLARGGAGGVLGYPLSDEQVVKRDGDGAALGASSRFENGTIYASTATGAWELIGPFRDYYEKQLGGPSAANGFGFPKGPQATSAGGNAFTDFEHGVIVNVPSGAQMGTYAFGKLQLFYNRVSGAPEDCIPIAGCSDPDVYTFVNATSSDGLSLSVRRPESGTWGGANDLRETFDLSPAAHGNLVIDITLDAWDSETLESDEHLAHIHVTYNVDNLFGLFDGGDHSDNSDGNGATFNFSILNPLPFDASKFRQNLFWSFKNFTTDSLTYDQFAATFTDVSPDEKFWIHPFNALFFKLAYKHIAKNGNCFGMCLESIFAQFGLSQYAEPIIRYWPDTQAGAEPNPAEPNEQQTINEINIKHGYQIGAEAIDWFLGRLIIGQTHDPKQVFLDSRDAFNSGDLPVISIMDSYFGGSGHAVRPYKWDQSDPSNWVMFIANPNNPTGLNGDADDPCKITIDTSSNTFTFKFSSTDTWSGSSWTGGRMLYMPFRHLVDTPRTPFWEVLGLLVAGTVILLGDSGQTQQITDGTGKTLFVPGLGVPPTRWDQYVQNPAQRVPNLTRVPLSNSGAGAVPIEMYYGRSAGATYVHEVVPAAGVASGTPYEWTLHSPTLSAHVVIPGTAGVPDVLTASNLHTPTKAVTVGVPASSGSKSISWTMSAAVKQRWMELTNLKMAPGQKITTRMSNAGYEFSFVNDGPATTADLRVQAGPGATPVVVGTIAIAPGINPPIKFDAPLTTLTPTPPVPNGSNGWYKTPVTIALSAKDYSGTGTAYTEYSKNGILWTRYTGPFVLADEGLTTIYYRSKDNDGDLETARTQVLKIDTRPPTVTGSFDKAQYTRLDPITIAYGATDPTPGSGVSGAPTATFDGQTLTSNPQTFPALFWQVLGTTNVLTVNANDIAGWSSTKSLSFQLVVTLASLRGTITQLRHLGEIDNDGIANSFLAKVDAAIAAAGRGQAGVARNQLSALLNELSAQSGKHVTVRAAQLLTGDTQYVQTHL